MTFTQLLEPGAPIPATALPEPEGTPSRAARITRWSGVALALGGGLVAAGGYHRAANAAEVAPTANLEDYRMLQQRYDSSALAYRISPPAALVGAGLAGGSLLLAADRQWTLIPHAGPDGLGLAVITHR